MANQYTTFNKVVMFTVESYIAILRKEGDQIPKNLERLRLGLIAQRKTNSFTYDEAVMCKKISATQEIKDIMNREVSFIVFSLELVKMWIEGVPKNKRPILGVSDKHFKLGGQEFWKGMLQMKEHNKGNYKKKKAIINDSKDVARHFYEYHYNKMINHDVL